jgi:DNA-binding NarL/FixJ family response regulator
VTAVGGDKVSGMAASIRVVVASAHDATRAGVRQALEAQGLAVCGEAVDAADAVEVVKRSSPDCCLLGVNLPGDALAAVAQIRTSQPQTSVVMLADDPNPRELLACIRMGATGYLPKSMNPDRLGPTIMDACNGGGAIPRRLVTSLVEAVRTGSVGLAMGLPPDVAGNLSRRELEVLDLLRSGETTGMIASLLSVSPVTVRRHVSSIVDKLGVADRQAAIELMATDASASSQESTTSPIGDSKPS